MFHPPRCPYPRCPRFAIPTRGFFTRHGSYRPRCRPRPVPRFRCRTCHRTFSRQTFRMDYRDHRPDLNPKLFRLLASGVGLRQSARMLKLSRHCTELKARKIGRHLRRLNLNLRKALPPGSTFQLDELETYEGRRNTRPLTVPVLIETASRFIVWAESAPIRPGGKKNPARLAAIQADQRRFGPRKHLSSWCVRRVLNRGAALTKRLPLVTLETDEKSTYPGLARRAFAGQRLRHRRTSSKLPRTTDNPLFPINHTEAIARDLMGRLRRDSWLASKRRRYLDVALHVFAAYRNLVRRRFNFDDQSPAQRLGLVPRRLTPEQVLSWRQDGGRLSIHPLATNGQSVEQMVRRGAA